MQGQSVLWTWKDSGEESHNIIHVNTPDSEVSEILHLILKLSGQAGPVTHLSAPDEDKIGVYVEKINRTSLMLFLAFH